MFLNIQRDYISHLYFCTSTNVSFSLAEALRPESLDNYISIGIYFVILSIIVVPSIYIQFYFLTPGTRRFHARIVGLIRNKLQRH